MPILMAHNGSNCTFAGKLGGNKSPATASDNSPGSDRPERGRYGR
jgi:hypothetical protein